MCVCVETRFFYVVQADLETDLLPQATKSLEAPWPDTYWVFSLWSEVSVGHLSASSTPYKYFSLYNHHSFLPLLQYLVHKVYINFRLLSSP